METIKQKLGKVSITVEKEPWSENKEYPRLTVVLRESTNTCYISRKAVPIGTTIDNKEYWLKFSALNQTPYELSQEFGDSPELSISQKTLTEAYNEVKEEIEEITSDKPYSPETFSGLGKVYLKKNVVEDKNILTQDMLTVANTIYYIQYDYDLNGETITVPEGCLLEFDGGSISNGTLVGQKTILIHNQELEDIIKNIELLGTFIDKDGGSNKQKAINEDIYNKLDSIEETIGEDGPIEQKINSVDTTLSARMDTYDELVDVSISGGTIGVVNNVDSIKPGQGKIPTCNAVAGIGRFAVANHWIYSITDATGKVVLGIKENGNVFANGFVNNIVVAKDGSGDYDNLSQAIIDTYGKKNVVLNILPGVYNIIEEMKELYGDDYWDNYDREQKIIYPDIYYDYGLRLGNGITLKGSSDTHIICKYTGNNDNVKVYFSPFNNDTGGFKMINLSIECSNVRYCVHDERGIDNVPYEVLYDSCYMESSNSTEASSPWKSNACIGGGLGINGHIKVINSVFNSTANNSVLVSYHDSSGDVSPQNYVICSGNYIKGQNGFGFTWNSKNGESKTRILCYGNSVGRQTHIGKESSAVSHDCDIEVLEWNNVIRNV